MNIQICYVLVTYGPHPRQNLQGCKAAQQQIRNLRAHYDQIGVEIDRFVYDYQRNVRSLRDLPNLEMYLKIGKKSGRGVLVVDDLFWLLQRPERLERTNFEAELRNYEMHIAGIRQKCRLAAISSQSLRLLLTAKNPRFKIRDARLTKKTDREVIQPGVDASKHVRSKRSDILAKKIADIRTSLMNAGAPARGKDIAAEANRIGLRTQRGGPISEPVVSRALSRSKNLD